MSPLTNEFIENLKKDLRANPFETEPILDFNEHDHNVERSWWRTWQHSMDRLFVEWDSVYELRRLRSRNGNGRKKAQRNTKKK
jgi:hypothetical protein